jgi:broad specificity phosphatase PhoE
MNNRYFLMRHGESQANLADLIISAPENGCNDYGLSQQGREQAKRSASNLELGSEVLIVASDFLRTKETAAIARETLGCGPIQSDIRLRERYFGRFEKQSSACYNPVWALDSADANHTYGEVESLKSLAQRLANLIQELESQHADATILLVSHGDPLRVLQTWAAGLDLTEHNSIAHFSPAEIRALDRFPRIT